MRLCLLPVVGLLASSLNGADLFTEAATVLHFRLNRRWEASVYGRGRLNAGRRRWTDASAAPRITYQIHPAVSVNGGMFFTSFQFGPAGRTMIYRPYAAVEPALRLRPLSFTARSRIERFFITRGLPDYSRFRQRFGLAGHAPWAPYASFEMFFTAEGFTRTRYAAGVSHRLYRRHEIEFSYFYEKARFTGPDLRHIVRAVVHLHFGAQQESD